MKEYTAIIPVAGKGVRLLPYTAHCPKTMLTVAGRPILAHILQQVQACGIKKVVFIVGYQKEVLIDFVRTHYPQWDMCFVQQPEPKGLGQAVYLAKPVVQGPCLIVLGDTIIDGDLRPLVQEGGNAVGVKEVADPRRFGVVEMRGGQIVGFEEKPEHPKSHLALIGAYAFVDSAPLFSALEEVISSGKTVKNEIQLTDALSVLLRRGIKITAQKMQNWFDCGTVEILLQTNRILLQRHNFIPEKFLQDNQIIPPCWIDETARLGGCRLGPYVSVAEGAVLKNCHLQDVIVSSGTRLEGQHAQDKIFDKYNR